MFRSRVSHREEGNEELTARQLLRSSPAHTCNQQVSDGGVHSHIHHLKALLKAAKDEGVPEAYVHFFGDGRDTDPKSGLGHLKDLQAYMKEISFGKVVTIVGRYYAMDRDKRWERIKVAVDALVKGEGEKTEDPVKTVEERYSTDETDEFLKVGLLGWTFDGSIWYP